jgi:amidase
VAGWLDCLFASGPFTVVFNISGHPTVSLPLAHSAGGLPIGVQLAAPHGREDLLFQVAAQLEQAMPWNHRTPHTHVGTS